MSKDMTDMYYIVCNIEDALTQMNELKLVELYFKYGKEAVDAMLNSVDSE